jgi:hypothetical protein
MSNVVREQVIGAIELTEAQLEAVFGGHGRHEHEKFFNDIDQDVDQKAAATYGNKEIEYSAVWCKADNDAKLTANIKSVDED